MRKIIFPFLLFIFPSNNNLIYADSSYPTSSLHLVTSEFEHPKLKTWSAKYNISNEDHYLLKVDHMGITQSVESEVLLVDEANNLGNNHGFLTFDYRLYRHHALNYYPDISELKQNLRQLIENEYPDSQLPYVVLISWLGENTRFSWFANWENFERVVEYDDSEQGAINTAAEEVALQLIMNTPSDYNLGLSAGLKEFNLLLNSVTDHLIGINGKYYSSRDTFFTCRNRLMPLRVEAFHADTTSFPTDGKTKWKQVINNSGNEANVNRSKASRSMSGILIQARYKDSDGILQIAQTRIVIVDVDFQSSAYSDYSFDMNEIKEYSQYRPTVAGTPSRFQFTPEGFANEVTAIIAPSDAWSSINFQSDSLVVSNIVRTNLIDGLNLLHYDVDISDDISKRVPQEGYIEANIGGCTDLRLAVVSRDTFFVNIYFVLVHEENDDIQHFPVGSGVTALDSICVDPGPNGLLDIQEIKGDDYEKERKIYAGTDGKCQTTANNTNHYYTVPKNRPDATKILRIVDSLNSIFGSIGIEFVPEINLVVDTVHFDENGNNKLDLENGAEMGLLDYGVLNGDKLGLSFAQQNSSAYHVMYFYDDFTKLIIGTTEYTIGGQGPFDKRRSYICPPNNGSLETMIQTTNHELGHAHFNLKHPWDEFASYLRTKSVYDTSGGSLPTKGQDPGNLMDYQNGRKLRKYQWLQAKFLTNL